MKYEARIFLGVIAALFIAACDQRPGEPSQADKALQELKQLYEEAKEKAPDDPIEWAKEDLRRAGDWEYRVVSLPAENGESLEKQLNSYGSDRWEVFWVRDTGNTITIFMKRPGKSYLMSAPLSDIGKAVSGAGSDE